MARYFSPSTIGFYDDAINQHWPDDVRPLSDARYDELMEAIAAGHEIHADASGDPMALPPPPPTTEKLLERLRRERDRLLTISDWTQMPDAPLDDTQRAAWRVYRQQLRDLPETITGPADMIWPEPPTGESN